jgi:hypothetical protein
MTTQCRTMLSQRPCGNSQCEREDCNPKPKTVNEIPTLALDLNEFEVETILDALITYHNKVGHQEESRNNFRVLRAYYKIRKFRKAIREMKEDS